MRSALVVTTSRRNLKMIALDDNTQFSARVPNKLRSVIVGDFVDFEIIDNLPTILSVHTRKNCLLRSYREVTKEIAANLDRLFIITAPGPAGVLAFTDRVITNCELRQIPHSIIVNKSDLPHEELSAAMTEYQKLGLRTFETSTTTQNGILPIIEELQNPDLKIVALAGVSGVGKSSILNTLIPSAARRTGHVSFHSGLGRQTTTQAAGYLYPRKNAPDVLVIDLPGIQSFGISHLSASELGDGFPEIRERKMNCEYLDCFHKAEPHCAVKDALEAGEIASFRYESYLAMLEEIQSNRTY